MTHPDHFAVIGDAVGPAPWMQLRQVRSVSVPAVAKNYDPADGINKDDPVQTVRTDWVNNTPMQQWVYGKVTRDGAEVTLQTRSRGYLQTFHGVKIDPADNPTITMTEVSRFGVGADVGKGGLLATGAAFSIVGLRNNSHSIPLMPQQVGMFLVQPGERIHAKADVRFKSDFWENSAIDGGDSGTEAKFITGELQIDLFALPAVATPLPPLQPTIVGGAANIKWDREIDLGFADTQTSVVVPSGLAEDDVLLAISVNNTGVSGDMQPVQPGWIKAHGRNEGLQGLLDVHLKMWTRVVGDPMSEPATYEFTNGLLAEQTTVIIPIRGTIPFDANFGGNWGIASNLSRFRIFEEHNAPSIEKNGQLLICLSYIAHVLGDLHQTSPAGMTEVFDQDGTFGNLTIATLVNPPNPTNPRVFVPNFNPLFTGHTIAATILVPGAPVF